MGTPTNAESDQQSRNAVDGYGYSHYEVNVVQPRSRKRFHRVLFLEVENADLQIVADLKPHVYL